MSLGRAVSVVMVRGEIEGVNVTSAYPGTFSDAYDPGGYARTVTLAVSAGSFGLMIVVVTAVLVIPAVRGRRPGYRSRHAG
jgi:hypothetical protein